MTMAIMAATVWFIPGWLRTAEPHEGILECVSNAFPEASVEFKSWDGDNLVWPISVDSADKEAWRFAFEVATMPPEERANLTLIGHSLGGRITARVLARLSEHGLKIRQAILMGAAIPSDDPDLTKMGRATELPVLAVCNPYDHVLRYVYAMIGGESSVASPIFARSGSFDGIAAPIRIAWRILNPCSESRARTRAVMRPPRECPISVRFARSSGDIIAISNAKRHASLSAEPTAIGHTTLSPSHFLNSTFASGKAFSTHSTMPSLGVSERSHPGMNHIVAAIIAIVISLLILV